MNEILDSDIAQAGGWTTVLGAVLLSVIEWLSHYEISDLFQGVMAAGGAVFLFYKIKNIRLDAKLKQRMLREDQEAECQRCKDIGKDEEVE